MQKTIVAILFILGNFWGQHLVAGLNSPNITTLTPDYMQVEKEVIKVTLPPSERIKLPSSTDASIVPEIAESKTGEAKSNVKARKGVSYEQVSSSTPSYKVEENLEEVHSPDAINTNLTSSTRSPIGRGEAVAIDNGPKKPEITYSPEDNSEILKSASQPLKSESSKTADHVVQSVEEPTSAFSKELVQDNEPSYSSYMTFVILSIVALIFIAVPIIFGRKLKDYWATRHYRRVDFLVEGMYD